MRYDEREWKIGFNLSGDISGCFGCTAAEAVGGGVWEIVPRGVVLCGGYDEVIKEAEDIAAEGFVPDAVIAFFSRNYRIEATLERLDGIFPEVPFCGGGAAPGTEGVPELYPANGDAALLLIRDERYAFENRFCDLHDVSTRKIALEGPDSRTITYITDGERVSACEWLNAIKKAEGYRAESFENVTLTTDEGYNLHLSEEDGRLCTGSDIPGSREVRVGLLTDAMAKTRIDEFLGVPGEFVCGCAGLRSMVPGVAAKSVCGFLHGEILTAGGRPHFANLMMSALSAVRR